MKKLLVLTLLFVGGCASSPTQKAYQAEAGLAAAYKVAAPLRAELCNSTPTQIPKASCDSSLKALKAYYVLLEQYGELLSGYVATKDQSLGSQLQALTPQIEKAMAEILDLIEGFKAGR